MDKETKEIMCDIVALIESMILENHPHAYFDDYILKIDKEKMDEIKEKLNQLVVS